MFTVDCPVHRSTVLLGPHSVTDVRNHFGSVELDWRCRCGATGTLSFRGRRLPQRAPRVAPPAPVRVPVTVPVPAPAAPAAPVVAPAA